MAKHLKVELPPKVWKVVAVTAFRSTGKDQRQIRFKFRLNEFILTASRRMTGLETNELC